MALAHIIDRVKFDTLAILDGEPLGHILAFEFVGHDQAGSREQNYRRTEWESRSSRLGKSALVVSI